jgi:HAE1 family hydrophobic/amphiphilic exporter-1
MSADLLCHDSLSSIPCTEALVEKKGRGFFMAAIGGLAVLLLLPPPGLGSAETEGGGKLFLTLEAAVSMALERNPDALRAGEDVNYARGRVTEVTAQALTQVSIQTDYTRNIKLPVIFFRMNDEVQQIRIGESNQYNINFLVTQPVYTFGRIGSALDVARIYLDMSESGEKATREGVAYETELAYDTALLTREVSGVWDLALEQARANMEQVRSFYESGTASEFDLLRAEVEYENTKPQVIRAKNDYLLALADLKRMMNLPHESDIELVDGLTYEAWDASLDENISLALAERPELVASHLNVHMMEKALTIEKASRYPVISFFTNYSIAAASPEFVPRDDEIVKSWGAGLSLEIPIFDGRRGRGRIDQARASFLAAKYDDEKFERLVRLEVEKATTDLSSTQEEIHAQEATVKQAERAYELSTVRYENGLSTQLEVRDAHLALQRAKTNYLEAVYRYRVARATLRKATGTLLPE